MGNPIQNIRINTDKINAKSKLLAGKTGNAIGRTIRFITTQTKIPYTNPEKMTFLFKEDIWG